MKQQLILFIIMLFTLVSCHKQYVQNPSVHNDGYYYVVMYNCYDEEHVTTVNVDLPTESTMELIHTVCQSTCTEKITKFKIVHSWETDKEQ